MRKLLPPEAASAEAARRFARQHVAWWAAADAPEASAAWPWPITLGMPTEAEVAADAAAVRRWAEAWRAWRGAGRVVWIERQWPKLGTHELPAALEVPDPGAAAALAGQGQRWQRAVARRRSIGLALPALRPLPATQRLFDAFADWPDDDFERLTSLLRWAEASPATGLRMRQLPVPGLDTKWIEARRAAVSELAAALPANRRGAATAHEKSSLRDDLYTRLGLLAAPPRLRLRLLDAALRGRLGGLGDVEAPADQIAGMQLAPRRVLVVENLETGLALPDLPGTVAFMKLGWSVALLERVGWLHGPLVAYWGDIDTHGFAILNEFRRFVPGAQSLLMDEATLVLHAGLTVPEPSPWAGSSLHRLTPPEHALFEALVQGRFGERRRLEQERIDWQHALGVLDAWAAQPSA